MIAPFYIGENDSPAKRAILRAALKLFADRGLALTSIRDIARESGYTNPALYKHFESKESLALSLFEACQQQLRGRCAAAVTAAKSFDAKLDAYVSQWLAFTDEHPQAFAFLTDSARILFPKSSARVRRNTVIGVIRSVLEQAPRPAVNVSVITASLEGTLHQVARLVQIGLLAGPAMRWKDDIVEMYRRLTN